MQQLVCKMCGGNELIKEEGCYVCQHCGCSYTVDMSEIINFTTKDNENVSVEKMIDTIKKEWNDIPRYNSEINNKIYANITRIGHAEMAFAGQQIINVFKDGFSIAGCGYEVAIYNIAGERIKYFTILSVAYNSVDDKLGAHVTRFTGPLESGEYNEYWVDGIWDDSHISNAKIDAIMIEFFNGQKILYSVDDVKNAPDNLEIIKFTGTDKIPYCGMNTSNKVYISILGVCHEELDMEASKRALGQLINKHVPGRGTGKFGVEIEVKCIAGKSIKSINAFLQPLNSVFDKVGERESVTINGPVEVGQGGTIYFELWDDDNHEIANAKIEGFIVNFMDGTSAFYKESDIANLNETSQITNTTATNSNNKSGGCYVATAVYGSYDCPQVWTLRRYRDYTLAETWYGRAFIKTYYAISPTLVKWFGHTDWFKNMWKGKLDRMVAKLQTNGVESTPYEDKNW